MSQQKLSDLYKAILPLSAKARNQPKHVRLPKSETTSALYCFYHKLTRIAQTMEDSIQWMAQFQFQIT